MSSLVDRLNRLSSEGIRHGNGSSGSREGSSDGSSVSYGVGGLGREGSSDDGGRDSSSLVSSREGTILRLTRVAGGNRGTASSSVSRTAASTSSGASEAGEDGRGGEGNEDERTELEENWLERFDGVERLTIL